MSEHYEYRSSPVTWDKGCTEHGIIVLKEDGEQEAFIHEFEDDNSMELSAGFYYGCEGDRDVESLSASSLEEAIEETMKILEEWNYGEKDWPTPEQLANRASLQAKIKRMYPLPGDEE